MKLQTKYGIYCITEKAIERVWAVAIGFGVSLEEATEIIIESSKTKREVA